MARLPEQNQIDRSEHREEIRELLRQGWSSQSCHDYLKRRYNIDIPPRVLRFYRQKKIKPEEMIPSPILDAMMDKIFKEAELRIDILKERATLIRLQAQRVAKNMAVEDTLPITSERQQKEIELLSKLLDDHKKDLQALGLFPQIVEEVAIAGEIKTTGVPQTLVEVLNIGSDTAKILARQLAELEMERRTRACSEHRYSSLDGDKERL